MLFFRDLFFISGGADRNEHDGVGLQNHIEVKEVMNGFLFGMHFRITAAVQIIRILQEAAPGASELCPGVIGGTVLPAEQGGLDEVISLRYVQPEAELDFRKWRVDAVPIFF